ncbi:hypothetical protein [Vulcaniibacterium tengchongense]|uniref:Uncharacterized protein n=1 Tax=Vulcaniibacterium tengchongense TaxID=1273429 RepID=A0A3N4VSA2_9GAMM|nr:hypothetical protein [Vulcaniibacterium tengchongense]RPE79957.1 hypothetical protein EDC50_1787 [Vulcaniibacterium tengchongense]
MRPDKQKLNAQHKEGAKRARKDLENRRPPKAASKQGHAAKQAGQDSVLRRDEPGGHRLH